MFRVFPARWGAVFLTALALCIPAGAVGQSAPADNTVEWARLACGGDRDQLAGPALRRGSWGADAGVSVQGDRGQGVLI